jgi:hypothetical protein
MLFNEIIEYLLVINTRPQSASLDPDPQHFLQAGFGSALVSIKIRIRLPVTTLRIRIQGVKITKAVCADPAPVIR